jgi:adenylyltransferase/sulfurtransferase
MSLNIEQKQRYLRNTILPEIGEKGQKKLLCARVLVIGAGGLGSAALLYLAAAGVGNIGVIDDDIVEMSNLQRQIIHNQKNLGQKKVTSVKEKISALNSDVQLEVFAGRVNSKYLTKISADYDFILDATDNFPTRFIINKICHRQKKPLIFAAVKGFLGQVAVFKSYEKNNPCYSCFNPNISGNILGKNCSVPLFEKGILGSVAGTIGAMQASYTIKEILAIEENLAGKILIFDFLRNNFRKVALKKTPACKICGH